MCVFLIGVWFITLFLEYLFLVFLFLKGAWYDTFYFWFFWIFVRCPLWTTWGSGTSVAPPRTWGPQAHLLDASLLFPSIHPISFIIFRFFLEAFLCLLSAFSIMLVWCFLGNIQHAFQENSGRSLARLLDALLLMAISFASTYTWPHEPIDVVIIS